MGPYRISFLILQVIIEITRSYLCHSYVPNFLYYFWTKHHKLGCAVPERMYYFPTTPKPPPVGGNLSQQPLNSITPSSTNQPTINNITTSLTNSTQTQQSSVPPIGYHNSQGPNTTDLNILPMPPPPQYSNPLYSQKFHTHNNPYNYMGHSGNHMNLYHTQYSNNTYHDGSMDSGLSHCKDPMKITSLSYLNKDYSAYPGTTSTNILPHSNQFSPITLDQYISSTDYSTSSSEKRKEPPQVSDNRANEKSKKTYSYESLAKITTIETKILDGQKPM